MIPPSSEIAIENVQVDLVDKENSSTQAKVQREKHCHSISLKRDGLHSDGSALQRGDRLKPL
jgi:hypothetical protein